jgi:hypothetical protein
VAISWRRMVEPYKEFICLQIYDIVLSTLNGQRYREEIVQPFFKDLHDDGLRFGFSNKLGPLRTQRTFNLIGDFFDKRIISRNLVTH